MDEIKQILCHTLGGGPKQRHNMIQGAHEKNDSIHVEKSSTNNHML